MFKDKITDIALTGALIYIGYKLLSSVGSKIITEIEPDFIKNTSGNFNLLPSPIASDATPVQIDEGIQAMYELPPLI